jgi:NADPH:quinone reductase-like Zn-dependent oxidoreductase
VTGFEVGDSVFGVFMKMTLGGFGTFSELVAAPAMFAAKIPNGLAVESAGALALAGATALTALDAIDPTPGEIVLISGATGRVGSFAVQLAKQRGATVIATARPEDADFVTGLGADETVDYAADLSAAVRAKHPDGIDAIVHASGDGAQLATLLKPGGRIASTIGLTAVSPPTRSMAPECRSPPSWACRRLTSSTGSPPPWSRAISPSRSIARTNYRRRVRPFRTSPPASAESSPSRSDERRHP